MVKNSKTKQLILAIVLVLGFVGESLGMVNSIRKMGDVLYKVASIVSLEVLDAAARQVVGRARDSDRFSTGGRNELEGSLTMALLQNNLIEVSRLQQQLNQTVSSSTTVSGNHLRPNRIGAILGTAIGYLPESISGPLLARAQGTLTNIDRVTKVALAGGAVVIIGGGYLLYRKASHSKQQAEAIKQKTETQKIVTAQKLRELEVQRQKDAIEKQKRWKEFVETSQDSHQVSQSIKDPTRKLLCLQTQDQMFKDGLKAFGYEEPKPKKKSWLGTIKDTFNDTADNVPLVDEVV